DFGTIIEVDLSMRFTTRSKTPSPFASLNIQDRYHTACRSRHRHALTIWRNRQVIGAKTFNRCTPVDLACCDRTTGHIGETWTRWHDGLTIWHRVHIIYQLSIAFTRCGLNIGIGNQLDWIEMNFFATLFTVRNHVDDANFAKITRWTNHSHCAIPVVSDKENLL